MNPPSNRPVDRLRQLLAEADEPAGLAPRTRRDYLADVGAFEVWAQGQGVANILSSSCSPGVRAQLLALYLADLAPNLSLTTIMKKLSALRWAAAERGLPSPVDHELVQRTLAAIRQRKRKSDEPEVVSDPEARLTPEVARILDALPDSLGGRRDRVLILLATCARLRRSDLAALRVADVEITADSIVIYRPEGGGSRKVAVEVKGGGEPRHDLVKALRVWLASADIHEGPLIRPFDRWGRLQEGGLGGRSITMAVRRAAERAGLDPTRYTPEALRHLGGE